MATPEHRTPIPKAPFWLSAGSLVPFVVITSAMWALPAAYTPPLLFWLTSYAAVTLSFAGGLAPRMPELPRAEVLGDREPGIGKNHSHLIRGQEREPRLTEAAHQ